MIALPFHPSNAYTIRGASAPTLTDILHEVERRPPAPARRTRTSGCACGQGAGRPAAGGPGRHRGLRRRHLRQPAAPRPTSCAGKIDRQRRILAERLPGQPAALSRAWSKTARSPTLMPGGRDRAHAPSAAPASAPGTCRPTTASPSATPPATSPTARAASPATGRSACVALMDARSIAATACNGGAPHRRRPSSTCADGNESTPTRLTASIYDNRVYDGLGKPEPERAARYSAPTSPTGPRDVPCPENLLLHGGRRHLPTRSPPPTSSSPPGETSSYRSNPLKLSEFALSRKDPEYVDRAKAVPGPGDMSRRAGRGRSAAVAKALARARAATPADPGIGSLVFALKPGDGSAREQAASCQKVLGGCANIAQEYATKRYRSNVVNWGMLPFILDGAKDAGIAAGDVVVIPGIRAALLAGRTDAIPGHRPLRRGQAGDHALAPEPDRGRARHHPGRMPHQLLRTVSGRPAARQDLAARPVILYKIFIKHGRVIDRCRKEQ